jgi:hypothetical protein
MDLRSFAVVLGVLSVGGCGNDYAVHSSGQSERENLPAQVECSKFNYQYIPDTVYDFRKELDSSNDLKDHVVVEIAPQMRKYIITEKDGASLRHFAQVYLHVAEDKVDALVSKRVPMRDFQRGLYLDRNDILYKRAEILAGKKDCNHDSVLTSLELYNSFPCVVQK